MKKRERGFSRAISLILAVVLAFSMLPAYGSVAADTSAASDDIKDDVEVKKLEQNINDLTKKQNSVKEELSSLKNDIDGLLAKKALYDELIEVSEAKIAACEQLISELNAQAETIRGKIAEKNGEIEILYEQIKERMVLTYESGGARMSYLEMVFGARSLAEFMRGITNAVSLLEYDTKLMNDYKRLSDELTAENEKLADAISKQKTQADQLAEEKAGFEVMLAQSENLLLDAMKDADQKEDILKRLEQEEEKANKELEDFIDELMSQKNQPVETEPPETKPPETEPPETDPPETDPPETDPPETDPPETDPPETDPPETNPPETEPPETEPPETEPPETEPPETEPPKTEAPETQPPETEPPKTEPPETEAPDTGSEEDESEYMWPLDPQYTHITSYFGKREDPFNPGSGVVTNHGGTDIYAPRGADIYASRSGTVVKSQVDDSYGNYIMIDHGDGYFTLYAHCSKLIAKVGDYVKKGDKIAEVGNTGHATGYHLHFEVRYGKTRLDALDFVDIPKN